MRPSGSLPPRVAIIPAMPSASASRPPNTQPAAKSEKPVIGASAPTWMPATPSAGSDSPMTATTADAVAHFDAPDACEPDDAPVLTRALLRDGADAHAITRARVRARA